VVSKHSYCGNLCSCLYKFASDLFIIDRDVVFTGLRSSVASGKCSKVFAKVTELTLKFLTLAGGHVK
jgi:hypothetical protein